MKKTKKSKALGTGILAAREILLLFATVLLLCGGCERDEINNGSGGGDADTTEDNIDNVTFDMVVTVTYNSTSCSVTMDPLNSEVEYSNSDCHVTVRHSGSSNVKYVLKGTASDGSFKLYSNHKQAVVFDGLTLTNPNGAAVNVQGPEATPGKGKRTYVVVNGTNTLSDGTTYSGTPSTEDEKGVIFSEGQLIFSGDGILNITAKGKSGIASDDYVRFMGNPTLNITSTAGHGVKANDYITVSGGTLGIDVSANTKKGFSAASTVLIEGGTTTIAITGGAAYDSEDSEYKGTAGVKADTLVKVTGGTLTITNSGQGGKGISCDGAAAFTGGSVKVTVTGSNYTSGNNSITSKGIICDGAITFDGGTVWVSSANNEGIESKSVITISDGEVYCYSGNDDAMNAAGNMDITGGFVCAHAGGSNEGDALDANGDLTLSGGVVYAIASRANQEMALDADEQHKLYVKGGVLIALGNLERGASLTQSCYSHSSWSKNAWYSITVDGITYAFRTPSSGGNKLVVSGSTQPTVYSGVTASGGTPHFEGMLLEGCTTTGGSQVSLTAYTNNGGWW